MPRVLTDTEHLPDPTPLWQWPWIEVGRLRRLQWSAYTIPLSDLPPALEGFRILHLTDPHINTLWMPAWDRLIERVQRNPPDLILLSGDFVDDKKDYRPAMPNVRRFLKGLPARLGLWSILGNHDGDVFGIPANDLDVHLLCNQIVTLRDGGTALDIVGMHGVMPSDASLPAQHLIGPKPAGHVRLVMAHFPHQIETLQAIEPDILFAGHTHGGQVCLPGGVPLITHDSLPRRYARGVHRIDNTWLSVGRGLGFSTYAIRSFCPAEAIEITLTLKKMTR